MLKIALFIVVGLALVLLAALIFAATKPDAFRVERSISINAPAEKIFPFINDFSAQQTWSAWEKVDPAMQRSISEPPGGVGAFYTWNGNSEIGQGRMEILAVQAPSKLTVKLEFMKPFTAVNTSEFTLASLGSATQVTQAMFGPSPFIAKVMGLAFSMDKMVGGKFEQGLIELKRLAEK